MKRMRTITIRTTPTKVTAQTVRQLRKALGDTQEAFARRLQTTTRTVARYENDGPPAGVVLARLVQIAAAHNLPALAEAFQRVIDEEVGDEHLSSANDFLALSLTDPDEILTIGSVLEAIRNPRHASIAAAVQEAIAPLREEKKRARLQLRRSLDLSGALLGAHREGKTERQIASFFNLPVEAVREWKRINGLTDTRTPTPEDAKQTQKITRNNARLKQR